MDTEASSSATATAELKCGGCRRICPELADVARRLAQQRQTERLGTGSDATLVALNDPLPDFVQQTIDQSGWTKGKLFCPHPGCQHRLGGFDFVSGADPAVYLVPSRVDLHAQLPQELHLAAATTTTAAAGTSDPAASSVSNPELPARLAFGSGLVEVDVAAGGHESELDSNSYFSDEFTPNTSSPSSCCSSEFSSAATSEGSDLTTSSEDGVESVDQDERELGRRDESSLSFSDSSANSESRMLSKRGKRNNARSLARKAKKEKAKRKGSKGKRGEERSEDNKMKKLVSSDADLDLIDDDLICPVCLDLLHQPFLTLTCKHMFCEPCLRRLGSKNVLDTTCPMCRQKIVFCEPKTDLARHIRQTYPKQHARRKKFEQSTSVYSLPLPWQPGWRNLFRGRAFGGNTFADETALDRYARIAQHLPYYVPPFLLGNLLNLLFILFVLLLFELVPLFLSPMSAVFRRMAPTGKSPTSPPIPWDELRARIESTSQVCPAESPYTQMFAESPQQCRLPKTLRPELEQLLHYLEPPPEPETPGPVVDATFYYILGTMFLGFLLFGNFFLFRNMLQQLFGHTRASLNNALRFLIPLPVFIMIILLSAPFSPYLERIFWAVVGDGDGDRVEPPPLQPSLLLRLMRSLYHGVLAYKDYLKSVFGRRGTIVFLWGTILLQIFHRRIFALVARVAARLAVR